MIHEEFSVYLDEVYRGRIDNAVQLKHVRNAFYAGAGTMFRRIIDDAKLGTPEGTMKLYAEIDLEIKRYFEGL